MVTASFHTAVEYPRRKWSMRLAWLYATKSWSYHHCAQLINAFCLIIRFNFIHVLTLAYKVSHDINAFNQLRTMVMGQLLGSRVACNMHRFLVKR